MSNQRHNQEILNSDANFEHRGGADFECADFYMCNGCEFARDCFDSEQKEEEEDDDEQYDGELT